MRYNDGQVHLEIYDNNEDKVAIAKDFSEGDLLLERCLLQLWDSNIKTMACCEGHDGGVSYLFLIIDSNTHPLINAICEFLYVQEGNIQLHFSKNAQDYKVLHMYMYTEKEKKIY